MTSSFLAKIAAVFGSVALMAPAPALADWVLVATSDDGIESFVETDSVTRSGQYVSFLQRRFLSVPEDDGTAITIAIRTINCTSGERYLHRLTNLTKFGQVVVDHEYANQEPEHAIPGSLGGSVHEFVCYQYV